MARRELQYYKDCEATKRQKTIKAKSISSVNRSAETITRVTGLDDPCEVLYQSTRSKHLRDPVSVVAKNIVPPSVGLGLRTRSGGLEPDISHHEAYKAEEQRLISTSAILAASKNKSSPVVQILCLTFVRTPFTICFQKTQHRQIQRPKLLLIYKRLHVLPPKSSDDLHLPKCQLVGKEQMQRRRSGDRL